MIDDLLQNPFFEESEALLIRLHEALLAKDEPPESDSLRNRLQSLDKNLTHTQREYLRGLSGDLYQLEDDEVPLRTDPDARLGERFERSVQRSLSKGDFGTLLHLLRTDESRYEDDRKAYLRGLAYAGLERYAPAYRFMRRAPVRANSYTSTWRSTTSFVSTPIMPPRQAERSSRGPTLTTRYAFWPLGQSSYPRDD